MNNETQNFGWEPLPLHEKIPLPPPPHEAEKKPLEDRKESSKGYVINDEEDPRRDDLFDDKRNGADKW